MEQINLSVINLQNTPGQFVGRHVAGRRRGERATADAGSPDLLGNLLHNSHGLFRSGALVTPVECVRATAA